MHVSSKWKILYLEEAVREGQCWRPRGGGSSPELSTRFFVPVCVCVFMLFFTFILVRVDRNSEFSQHNS